MFLSESRAESIVTSVAIGAVGAGRANLVHFIISHVACFCVVTHDQGSIEDVVGIVDHATTQLLCVSPDHLGVVPGTVAKPGEEGR